MPVYVQVEDKDDMTSTLSTVHTSSQWQDDRYTQPTEPAYPRDTPEVNTENPNPAQDKSPPRYPRRVCTQARQAYIPTMDTSPSYPTGYANVNVTPGYVGSLKITDEDLMEHVLGVALAQVYGLKAGLRKFGERGGKSFTEELKQHENMGTYIPVDPSKLTPKQKKMAVESLLFLTEKRDGK